MTTKNKSTDMKMGELIDAYSQSPEFTTLRPSSQKTYSTYLHRLTPIRGRYVSSLKTGDIMAVVEKYHQSPGAQAQVFKMGRVVLAWGLGRGLLRDAPALQGIRIRRGVGKRQQPREPWTDAEIMAFRRAARRYAEANGNNGYVVDAMEIGLATGQRISDIAAMRMSGWDGEFYEHVQIKTGTKIRFRPQGEFLEILRRREISGSKYVLEIPFSDSGGRLARLHYHFDAVRTLANVTKTFHGLRKTVAVRLRENGATDAQAAAILGHKSTRMIAEYAKRADQTVLASQAAEVMANIKFGD